MSKALYRKYRSKSLDEIVGQDHITAILQRAIERDKIAHAYLLTGPKGVGKTSIARILAHAINNLPYSEESQHLDIIEIDAASNNSVEDIRDLREKVQIAPVSAKRKVYIIDEVHMLSKQAFNALLKTLEEPPEHIVFILATTDADKLPATIISRVQRFNFRAINEQSAIKHLKAIAKKEKIAIEDDALQLIASHGKGSFRDSIGLLDQMQHVSDGAITRDMVAQILGLADNDMIASLLNAYDTGDLQTIVTALNTAATNGTPAHVIAEQLIRTIRDDIVARPQLLPLLDALLDVTKSAWPEIKLLTALTKSNNATRIQSGPHSGQSLDIRKPSEPQSVVSHVSDAKTPKDTLKRVTAGGAAPTLSGAAGDVKEGADQPAGPADSNLRAAVKNSCNNGSGESKTPAAPNKPAAPALAALVPFDWQAFSEAVKPKAAGAFSLLKNCGHDYDGATLTIYGGKKFNKTKLDKSLPELSAALTELSMVADIIITDTVKPPEDATTAAILDMMGGGEELSAPA